MEKELTEEFTNNFAYNLSYLRKEKKLTQFDVAKIVNKDYSTIGKWELKQRFPTMGDVIKLSNYFNVPLDNLLYKKLDSGNKEYDELDLLFSKNKDILTEEDKTYIKFIIEKRRKEIDKELGISNDN